MSKNWLTMKKVKDLDLGTKFRLGSEDCIVIEKEGVRYIKVFPSGMERELEPFGNMETGTLSMPKTPEELIEFIHEFQIQQDEEIY